MTNLNVRVDEKLKADAQALYKSMGMDLSTAINVFLRQSVRMQGMPFRPQNEGFYAESNLQYLETIMDDVKQGKAHFAEHELIEVE